MTNFLKKQKLEFIILGVALITRLFFYILFLIKFGEAGFVYGDGEEYLRLTENLLNYGVFSRMMEFPFLPDAFRAPAYTLFIAGPYFIFRNLWSVIFIQNIIGAFSALLVFALGKKLFNKTTGTIAALIFALEPNLAFWSNYLFSETLFVFFLLLATLFFVKFIDKKNIFHIFLSGFLLGLTAMARFIGQYLPFIFVLFLIIFFFSRIPIKKLASGILIFITIFLVTIAPWSIRNKIQFDTFKLSWKTIIFCGTNKDVYLDFAKKKMPPIDYAEFEDNVLVHSEKIVPTIPFYKNPKESSMVCQGLIKIFKHDPVGYTYLYLRSLVPFFLGSGYTTIVNTFIPETDLKVRDYVDNKQTTSFTYFLGGHVGIQAIAFYGGLFLWITFTILMLAGFVFGLRDKKKMFSVLFFAVLIIYFATTSGFGGFSRFRIPVNPFIFILVAYGALEGYRYIVRIKSRIK